MNDPARKVLEDAIKLVTNDRAKAYGDMREVHARIASMWSALVGAEITPVQVALMLGLMKVARAADGPPHRDNFVDLAGYAAIAGQLSEND